MVSSRVHHSLMSGGRTSYEPGESSAGLRYWELHWHWHWHLVQGLGGGPGAVGATEISLCG